MIRKLFSKNFLYIVVLLVASISVFGAEKTLQLSSSAKFGTESGSTLAQEEVTWTATSLSGDIRNTFNSATYLGQQFGTSSAPWTGKFSAVFSESVVSVRIVANTGGKADLSVVVGGTTFYSASQDTVAVVKKTDVSPNTYEFTGSGSGELVISVSNTSQAFYLNSVVVTTVSGSSIVVNPTTLNFEEVVVNESKSLTFVLNGSGLTSAVSLTTNNALFSVSPSSVSPVDGLINNQLITVTYSPTAVSNISSTAIIAMNCGGTVASVSASGVCVAMPIFELVADASNLLEGDEIVLVSADAYSGNYYAMNKFVGGDNNCKSTIVQVEDNQIGVSPSSDIAIITLEGNSASGWNLSTSEGYFYAVSSSSNYMKAKAEVDESATWDISIGSEASIVARGDKTRNNIRFYATVSSQLFSCYESGKQKAVAIYKKKSQGSTGIENPVIKPSREVSEQKVYASNGVVYAKFNGTKSIKVFAITGQILDSKMATNNYSIALRNGIYIVKLNQQTYKVLVK
ncbi:MAG: hypothetical protein J6U44_02840 [Paludibacteraceae bacterium]|nr:hypothetical protein [Paludibacteraceae bacterium]